MCDDKNYVVDTLGYAGGFVLSVCLLPQIYKTLKTWEVEHISYLWQILYIIGLGFHLYYSIYYYLLPILIPTAIELCLILFLFGVKIYISKTQDNKLDE